ncbi:hypothetical protein J7L01_02920 [bacterium]|nr:hypothetical protein [bacterium]
MKIPKKALECRRKAGESIKKAAGIAKKALGFYEKVQMSIKKGLMCHEKAEL